MHNAAQAYGSIAKKIASPRDLEADLLLKAAARLQAIRDEWDSKQPELSDALSYNRKLWTFFLSSVTDETNQLPTEVRQNVANLGIFVVNQTLALMADPQQSQLSALININRELAAGLRGAA